MTPFLFLLLFNVRGVVFDPTARPVEGAKVSCGQETISTDAAGRFEFHGSSSCEATIAKPGFASQTVHLTDSEEKRINLALAPTSDRVIVTASGSPVALEESGVAADVFTADDFEKRQFPFIPDVLRDVAGLNVVQTGRGGGITTIFPRGADSSNSLVLLDGVPITEPGGSMDFAHLTTGGVDRLEVVRGPESALYGAEGSNAVIQIFTRHGDPETDVPHGSISYERGSFSTDHWNGSVDGGLLKRIDYAFTAGQFRTTGEGANDAYRIISGTANIGYHFSNSTILRAVFRDFDSYTGVPGQVAYSLTDYTATETARDSALSVRLDDARGSRLVQHSTFGYHRYRDQYQDPNGAGPYNLAALVQSVPGPGSQTYVYLVGLVDPSTSVAPPGTTLVTAYVPPYPSDGLTITDRENVSYLGTLTQSHGSLSGGYEFERQAGLISGANVARYDNGAFVSEQYALTPRIFVTGSARFQNSSTFGSQFTPRGAITFRLPTNTYFHVSAARGIREPELLDNFARESTYVGNPNLKPETTESYEAGLSREWFSRRLRTYLSFFRNSFHDLIEFDFSTDPATWRNIERSWARGAEASGALQLTRYAKLRGNYTRLYTKITQSNAGDEGQQLQRRPLNSGSISLELAPRRWTLIAGARFVGERQESDFVFYAINRNPGYQYVFASASWQATRHFAPFLRIQNALNQQYQEVLGYSAFSRDTMGGVRVTW